ncbi:tetratricopeptide repeat protein [Telluria beijingensis]|uniref:tetratricopeptide repeat protein n=1 Tax=Telluria beijingensis TaxID=3068633 RepID=UPI002795A1C1|nr:tetratricopeptide repeat protein [Massilia sp. REN29]
MLAKGLAWWVPVLLLGVGCDVAHAVQTEPTARLVHEKRFGEARRAIEARLARDATDPVALAASVDLRIARSGPDDLLQARAEAERCVRAHSDSSRCAEALGNALTAQSRAGGAIALVRNARVTRDALERALRFDPMNYRAWVALMRFYLDTPFFLGGSEVRARELATEARYTDPDLTRLMRAIYALEEGKRDEAEQHILAADLREYVLVQGCQRELLLTLATAHLDAGRHAQSSRLFQELSRRLPSSELGPYGLALVARAQGRLADAALHLEKAAAIAPRPYVYKTLGEVYEERHDRPRAIAAYQAALTGVPPLTRGDQAQVTAHLAQLRRH